MKYIPLMIKGVRMAVGKKIIFICVVLFGFSLVLGMNGCTKKKLANDTLYFNLSTEPPTLDPTLSTDTTSSLVIRNIFDGLVAYDITNPELPVVPKVAKSWEISKNRKTYTFSLRDDVYWSDGKKVTAHDFLYSWERLLTPATGSEYAYFLFDIENAKAFNSGQLKDFSKVGIKAVNDQTFKVTLKEPVAYFLAISAFPVLSPIRKDIIEKYKDQWTEPQNIVTNGPFKVAQWKHDYELILERNDAYFGEKAKLKRVHCYMVNEASTALSLFQTRKLDVIREVPVPDIPKLKKLPEFHSGNYFSIYYLGFNTKKAPFDNVDIRRAVNAAINRVELVEVIGNYGQIPTSSLIPKNLLGYNQNLGIKFNLEKAKVFMEKAGYTQETSAGKTAWVNKKTKQKLPPITITYNTNEAHKTIVENMQAQLKRNLGFDVEILNQEWKVYLKTLQTSDGNLPTAPFHIYRLGWNADYPDPSTFTDMFTSYSEQNHTGWKSTEYDHLVEKAKVTAEKEKRSQLYDQAQKLLLEDGSVIIPIYVYSFASMFRDEIKGVHLNPLDEWQLDQIWLTRK